MENINYKLTNGWMMDSCKWNMDDHWMANAYCCLLAIGDRFVYSNEDGKNN